MSINLTFKETPTGLVVASEELNNESRQMMAETDINLPPTQDSPQNIVNILNDDCLQLVLLKLKDLPDFWSAAQVCTKFQANAKVCFPFKKVDFGLRRSYKDEIFIDLVEDFLCVFGPEISSINCFFKWVSLRDDVNIDFDEKLRLITQYCGQTLSELEFAGEKDVILHLSSPFQTLKKLKIASGVTFCRFDASSMFPELQSLEIYHVFGTMNWIANHFPKLKHVKIGLVKMLTDEIFIDFQRHNPQLQSLDVDERSGFTPLVWENIGYRLPNIVELCTRSEIGVLIGHLSTLRHLRKLHLVQKLSSYPKESKSFFSSLVENNQPIEELSIRGVDIELGKILQKLQTIKMLYIYNTSEDVVVNLVEHLPALEFLQFNNRSGISLSAVKKILQNCKRLTKFVISDGLRLSGILDMYDFDAIVALATGRVKLRFKSRIHDMTGRIMSYKRNVEFRQRYNEWVH